MAWSAGDNIVQENYYAGHLITAFPVTVVSDSEDALVLYTAAGSTSVDGTMHDRATLSLVDRMAVYQDPDPKPLEERTTHAHALTINRPRACSSVFLFWSPDWRFQRWYVNLQWPYERTDRGIAHGLSGRGDLFLDIVVEPDLSWSWKDADEFEAAVELGLLSKEDRRVALEEAQRVIERIESRASPFKERWPEWRPARDWRRPHLRVVGTRSWEFAG